MRTVDTLTRLLACAEEALDPKPCRVFKYPGERATHDNCQKTSDGNGQLWVANLDTYPGWPEGQGIHQTTCALQYADKIEVGVVRCAQGKIGDDFKSPDASLVTADAEMQQEDKEALRRAILCCFVQEGSDVEIDKWEAIKPKGGCVGGVWTIKVKDSGCSCNDVES